MISLRIRVHRLATGLLLVAGLAAGLSPAATAESDLPATTWVQLQKDAVGARRGCAIRYAPDAGAFFLGGFLDADPEFRQEEPAMAVPEYALVAFDLDARRWRNHLPRRWEAEWSRKLPPSFVPRCYIAGSLNREPAMSLLPICLYPPFVPFREPSRGGLAVNVVEC